MVFRRRRRNRVQPRTPIATGQRYGEYVLASVDEIETLLESALPRVEALVNEQASWTRPQRDLLKQAFAEQLGIDTSEPVACQVVAYANEYGYACRRFEELLLEHEDASAPLLTYLMTMWASGDPALSAWDLMHRTATGFALHLTTDATGALSYHVLPGGAREVRTNMQQRTIRTVLGVFGGRLVGGVTSRQLVQAWEHGFVERYSEMSMPTVPGVTYGDYPARVPAADPSSPPPGLELSG